MSDSAHQQYMVVDDLHCIVETRPPGHKYKPLRKKLALLVRRNRRIVNGLTHSNEFIHRNCTEIKVDDLFIRGMHTCRILENRRNEEHLSDSG